MTAEPLEDLQELAASLEFVADEFYRDPIEFFEPTPPQLAFFKIVARAKQLRGPNQAGKTAANAWETIQRMRGTHPWVKTTPPTDSWTITTSWSQCKVIMRKFYELIPKDELSDSTHYTKKNGFAGTAFELTNGSLHTFVTAGQDTVDLASATLDYIGPDEPPPEHIWGELVSRVRQKRGTIGLTYTPINMPVDWLKQKVEDNEITEVHFELTEEACTPIPGPYRLLPVPRPFLTAPEIVDYESDLLENERDQRVRGSWEGATVGRFFSVFDKHMIRDETPMGRALLGLGLDHGSDAGSEVAVLSAVDAETDDHPWLWVLDEYACGEDSTVEQDALGILDLLARNGLSWHDIDVWRGDRFHGGKQSGGQKSNQALMEALGRILGFPVGKLPFEIRTAFKPRNSVIHHGRMIHATMARGQFCVRPRCTHVIKSLSHWRNDRRTEKYKHPFDALQYGAIPLMKGNPYPTTPMRLR